MGILGVILCEYVQSLFGNGVGCLGGFGWVWGFIYEGVDYGGGCGGVVGSCVYNEYCFDCDCRYFVIFSFKVVVGDVVNDDIGGVVVFDLLNFELF